MEQLKSNVVCFYHSNCLDGIAAAYAVKLAHPMVDVEFIPSRYGMEIPDLKGCQIYVVDFSFKRPDMERLMANNCVVVLDHHESAAKELEGLVEVDQTRSGAMQAWEYFFGGPAPLEYQFIQDRDLFEFKLEDTHAWIEGAFTFPMTMEGFNELFFCSTRDEILALGKSLLRKKEADLKSLIKNVRRMTINGIDIPVLNANYMHVSDVAARLNENEPFVAVYADLREGRKFSLRSKKDKGMDVCVICESFGGGGHKNAASFFIPYDNPQFPVSHLTLTSPEA